MRTVFFVVWIIPDYWTATIIPIIQATNEKRNANLIPKFNAMQSSFPFSQI